jgi:hypothetical protein
VFHVICFHQSKIPCQQLPQSQHAHHITSGVLLQCSSKNASKDLDKLLQLFAAAMSETSVSPVQK